MAHSCWIEDPRDDSGNNENEEGCGKEPLDSARVESFKGDCSAFLELS